MTSVQYGETRSERSPFTHELCSPGGQQQQVSVKDCAAAADCVSGSLNLGLVKTSLNTKCCSTDLCNNQTLPAWSFGSPNGKKCYTCMNNDCTKILNCDGDEDLCAKVTEDIKVHGKTVYHPVYKITRDFFIIEALSFGFPNGRRCYTCVGNDCTKTLNCEGIEDHCITIH
ncbi:hypothetical protein NFI96_025772, partial [Prochilodus magdalenae]